MKYLKKKLRSEPEEDEDDNMDYLKNDSNENNNQSESDIKKKEGKLGINPLNKIGNSKIKIKN